MTCIIKLLPDLTTWPDPAKTPRHLNVKINPDLIIKVGDLHANPLKKLWCLVYFGILDLDKDRYEKLRDIIVDATNKRSLTDGILKEFNGILTDAGVHAEKLHVFLELGDKYSDRRGHDNLMLELDDSLNKKLLPYKTLISNHDLDLISFFHGDEKYWDHKNNTLDKIRLRESWIDYELALDNSTRFNMYELSGRSRRFQDYSLQLMINSLDSKKVNSEKTSSIFHKVYLPHLCLVFYTLEDNGISIDMHAPNPLSRLKEAINELYEIVECYVPDYLPHLILYNDETKEKLAKSIDCANHVFSEIIQGKIGDDPRDELIDVFNTDGKALHALCWSRYQEYDEELKFSNDRANGTTADYEIYITNGHDNPLAEQDFSDFNTCLNDQCGQYEDTKYNAQTKADTNSLLISVHKKGLPLCQPELIDLTESNLHAHEEGLKKLAWFLPRTIQITSSNRECTNSLDDWDSLVQAISSINCDSEELEQAATISARF
jgi:hypothetical protein